MNTICSLTTDRRGQRTRHVGTLAIALFMMALAPGVAAAQSSTGPDARWTAWLGCWELLDDTTRDAGTLAPGGSDGTLRSARRPPGGDMRVCVLPAGSDAGVTMTTWAGDRVVLEQKILADGNQHPFDEANCRGSQRSEWSQAGQRLFTRAELDCKDQPRRTVSGVTLMAKGPTWLDIQSLDVGGDQVVRVRRYQRSASQPPAELSSDLAAQAIPEAQRAAATTLSVDDVIEANSKMTSKVVEAMIAETGATFDLNSRQLVRLDEAGVEPNVTDLMVALSFPDRFVIERQSGGGSSSGGTGFWGMVNPTYSSFYSSPLYSPYSYSPYGYPYSPFGYSYSPFGYSYSPYAYSPFAYPYWSSGYYGGYYGSAPYYRLTSPGSVGSMPTDQLRTGTGRVVAGRGYTRVRPRDGSSGTAQAGQGTSSSSGGDSSAGSSGSEATGSSGGSVSKGGYSRGGSGSGSGGGVRSGSGGSGGGSSSGGGRSSGGSGSGRTARPR